MLVVDAMIVLAFTAALVAGGVTYVRSTQRAVRADSLGSRELAQAMRLLDRARAVDDAIPQLPSSLRGEIDRVVSDYYKEIER